jgi:multiple sugar transport system ATP-binding protein
MLFRLRFTDVMAEIKLENLTKNYPGGVVAVDDVSLEIADGEFIVLVGPSGCGKSTLLRMIAGLEEVSGGRILIDDADVTDLAPRKRDIAMVFQSYALYPHMSVRQNIGYGLKVRRQDKAEIERRVEEVAALLGLEGLLDRRPVQLSGGQRQRVAMGRAIVREPKAFLMDEPLSNLDAKLRVEMRAEIARLQRELGVTTIYVTHDQIEAMTLGDRVAVLRDGLLQQFDDPGALYERPVNLFVAEFIGSPAMNLVGVDLKRADGGFVAEFGDNRLRIDEAFLADHPALERFEGRRVILGIRPEDMEDAALASEAPDERRLSATVDIREDMGSEVLIHFGVGARPVRGEDVAAAIGAEAMEATEEQAKKRGGLFVARLGRGTRAREGERIEVLVRTEHARFFDPETGLGIYDEAEEASGERTSSRT